MEVIDNFASADLEQTYGLVNIPVCSLEDLLITGFEDHTNADENPNYP